jgi:hypothetical protein
MTLSLLWRTSLLSVLIAMLLAHWSRFDHRGPTLIYAPPSSDAVFSHYDLDCLDRQRESSRTSVTEENVAAHLVCSTRFIGSVAPDLTRYEVHYPRAEINRWQVVHQADGEPAINPLPAPLSSDFGYAVALHPTGQIETIQRTGPRAAFPNARLYEEEQNTFVKFLPRLFVTVAGRRLGPEAAWSSTRIQRIQTTPGVVALLQTTMECRFIHMEADNKARIAVTFRHEFAAADASGESRGQLRESSGSGELVFDLRTRRPLTFQAHERVRFDIRADDGSPTHFERTASVHLRPTDTPPATLVGGSGTDPIFLPSPAHTSPQGGGEAPLLSAAPAGPSEIPAGALHSSS